MHQWFITLVFIVLCVAACSSTPKGVMPTNAEPAVEQVAGDAVRGEELFKNGRSDAPACSTCHQTQSGTGVVVLGPNLNGIADRAGERIEGLEAVAYIYQSIVHPSEFLVQGYRNLMYSRYGEQLSPQDVADLVAYLLTL